MKEESFILCASGISRYV